MIDAQGSLIYEVSGPIARLTLNRPDKRNALDSSLISGLSAALTRAEGDEGVRVVTLTGAGKDFCAGADVGEMERMSDASVADSMASVAELARLYIQLRDLDKPVVGLVKGRALAGGCGLATACDLVVAAESALFGYTEIHLGFVPAMVMAILRRNVSEKRAFELMAFGDSISATEAERVGLVNQVFADDRFDEAAAEYVARLAERSASAIRLGKRLLYHQDGLSFEAAIHAGADVNVLARMTDDTRRGVADFLAGKRKS